MPVTRERFAQGMTYESQTLTLAGALMTEFGHELSSVELIPWFDGSFDVSVGGSSSIP